MKELRKVGRILEVELTEDWAKVKKSRPNVLLFIVSVAPCKVLFECKTNKLWSVECTLVFHWWTEVKKCYFIFFHLFVFNGINYIIEIEHSIYDIFKSSPYKGSG